MFNCPEVDRWYVAVLNSTSRTCGLWRRALGSGVVAVSTSMPSDNLPKHMPLQLYVQLYS